MKTTSATKSAQFMAITPALAGKWLDANTENRHQRKSHITALAGAMKRGEWLTTHQGVAFLKSGKLVDGQHRLEAIIKADITVEMLVVMGLGEDTFKAIDVGATRTIADVTRLPQRKAEMGRFFATVLMGNNLRATADQVLAVTATGAGRIHDKLSDYCGGVTRYYASTPMRCAAVSLIMNGHDQEAVFKNYANLVNQKYSEMSSAGQALVRQVSAGKVFARETKDTYARGLKVLDPDNAGLQRINISQSEIDSSLAYCKSTMRRYLAAD